MNKNKLGRLIGILRREKLKTTKMNRWLQVEFCDGICSKSTLSKIESGESARFDEVYEGLSERLSLLYSSIDIIDDNLEVLEEKLFFLMEEGIDDQVVDILEKMHSILVLGKKLIYYKQQLEMVDVLMSYYKHKIFNVINNIDFSIEFLDVYSNKFSSCWRMYLYLYIHHTMEDKEYKNYSGKLKLETDQSLLSQICYFHLLFVNKSKKALEVFEKISLYCIENDYKRRFQEVKSIIGLYSKHYSKELPLHIQKLIEADFEDTSVMVRANQIIAAMGSQNNSEIKKMFNNLIEDNDSLPIHTLVSYMSIFGIDGLPANDLETKKLFGRESYKWYLKYFKIDDDPYLKQEYIMDILYPRLIYSELLFVSYFTEQVYELCIETKKYKDLRTMLELLYKKKSEEGNAS